MIGWAEIITMCASCITPDDTVYFNKLFNVPFCHAPHCERFGELYRQRTFYGPAISNYVRLCDEHRAENDAYWNELWDEYYSQLGVY